MMHAAEATCAYAKEVLLFPLRCMKDVKACLRLTRIDQILCCSH